MCAYIHTHNRAYTTRGHWKPCRIFHPSPYPEPRPSECSQLHKQPPGFRALTICGTRSRAAPKSKVIFIKLKKSAGLIFGNGGHLREQRKNGGASFKGSPPSEKAPEKLHTLTELNESSKHGHGQYNNTPAKGAGLKTHLKRHKKEPPPSSKRRELSFSFVDPLNNKEIKQGYYNIHFDKCQGTTKPRADKQPRGALLQLYFNTIMTV